MAISKKPFEDNAGFTAGLRRILTLTLLVGCGLAILQIVAVSRLQSEIQHWAWVSEVDRQRERLFSEYSEARLLRQDLGPARVLIALDDLSNAVALRDVTRAGSRPSPLVANTRSLFVEAEASRILVDTRREGLAQSIDRLQAEARRWSQTIADEIQKAEVRSASIDRQQRRIAGIKTSLTSTLFAVQALQQQIIAVERLEETAPFELIASSIAGLDTLGIQTPCLAAEQEEQGRICSPNSTRLITAIQQMRGSDAVNMGGTIRQTLWAAEAYSRAGQIRLTKVENEQAVALDEASILLEKLADLREVTSSLSRINRALSDLDSAGVAQISTDDDLEDTHRLVTALASQIRVRMRGVLMLTDRLAGDPDIIGTQIDAVLTDWQQVAEALDEQIALRGQFSDAMQALSSYITKNAIGVRTQTTLWVNIYTSTFVALSTVLGASFIGLVWLAQRKFVVPLSSVTGNILRLARGELERSIVFKEGTFGFDKLGTALERLRLDMVERRTLAERNEQQTKVIEANIAELEHTNKEMEWLALHDTLTGLGNRRNADQALGLLTQRSMNEGCDFCVMQIDIDRFKEVNDALGHPAGDFVLKTVADILTETAGQDANCYRIGGDEFIILYVRSLSDTEALAIVDAISTKIAEPLFFDGHRCSVGSSIGVAFGRDADFDAAKAIVHSDLALYDVKRNGRNGWRLFTEALRESSQRRQALFDKVVAAIKDKSFMPYYQLQFYADDLTLRGAEVLCRWHDPDYGWISPFEALSAAEELGVVSKIDEILFEKVAQDLATLSEMGFHLPKVSFNVTAERLLKAGLGQELRSRINYNTMISIELLESMSLDDPSESVMWAIDSLKEQGIEIEIDDFGSSKASLAGLMAVSPHAMKIDRAIIMPIVESQRHYELVKKIIDIGSALELEVVAEGVETNEHIERLKVLGCDVLQGFGLARPMAFDDLAKACRHHSAAEMFRDVV